MGQRVVILEVQSFTVARGFTVECQWNGGSGGPGEGLGLPPSLDFLRWIAAVCHWKSRCAVALGGHTIWVWDPEVLWLVAASVSNYTGSGATKASEVSLTRTHCKPFDPG